MVVELVITARINCSRLTASLLRKNAHVVAERVSKALPAGAELRDLKIRKVRGSD